MPKKPRHGIAPWRGMGYIQKSVVPAFFQGMMLLDSIDKLEILTADNLRPVSHLLSNLDLFEPENHILGADDIFPVAP